MIPLLLLFIAVWGACKAESGFTAKQQYEYFYEGVVRHDGGGVRLRCNVTVQAVTKNKLYCKLSQCQYAQSKQNHGPSSGQGSNQYRYGESHGPPSGQVSNQYQYGESHGPSSGQGSNQYNYQYGYNHGPSLGPGSNQHQYPHERNHGSSSGQGSNQYNYQYGENHGPSLGPGSNQHQYPHGRSHGSSSGEGANQYQYQYGYSGHSSGHYQYPQNPGKSSGQNYDHYHYHSVLIYHNLHTPFHIEMKNGVVHKLRTEKNTPMWVTNVQKSVVSLFQLDIRDKYYQQYPDDVPPLDDNQHQWRLPLVYNTMEKSQYGECETTYQVMPPDMTLQKQITKKQLEDCYSRYHLNTPKLPLRPFTVIKLRNTENCSSEAGYTSRSTPNSCRPSTERPDPTPKMSHQGTYVLEGDRSHYTIYKVHVTSHTGYDTYNNENNLYSVSEQTLLLKERFPMGTSYSEDMNPKDHELVESDLRYSGLVSSSKTSEYIPEYPYRSASDKTTQVLESLNMIDSELNGFTTENHGYVASAVIQAEEDMSSLDYKSLDAIKSNIVSPTNKEIYYDMLALTGSNPAVEVLVGLMEQYQVSPQHASRILSMLSSQVKTPNVKLIRRLNEFGESDFVKNNAPVRLNLAMTLGNLFYRSCVQSRSNKPSSPDYVHGYYCDQNMRSLMEEFITKIANEMKRTKSPEKLALIQSIGNVGSPSIKPVIQQIITGDSSRQAVSQAIYSLKRLGTTYCKEVQDLTSAIFWDIYKANEVRVAAVTMQLICNPPLHYWKKLAMSTWSEPSKEVRNFVSSAIESYANTEDDALRSQKVKAQQCLSLIRYKHKNWFQSGKYDFGSIIKKFVPGATGRTSLVSGTHSSTPKTVYMSLKNFIGGFSNGEGKVILNGAGVNHVMDEIFSSLNQVDRRRWNPDGEGWPEGMRNVMQQLQTSRPEDIVNPSLSFMATWNQYIQSFHYFDTMDYYDLKMKMRSDYSSQFKPTQAIYYLQDQVHCRPSEIGLPTYYSEKVPLVLSMRGNVGVKWQPSRSLLQLTMKDTTPTVVIYRRTSLQITNPLSNSVVEYGEENSFHMSAPIDADFQIDFESQQLKTSVQLRQEQPGEIENFQLHFHRVPYSRSATYDARSGLGKREIYPTSPVCHYHPEVMQQYGQPNLDTFNQQRDYLCSIQKARAYHADYNILSTKNGFSRFETAFVYVDKYYQTPKRDPGNDEKQQQYSKVESTIAQARHILQSEHYGPGAAVVAVTSLYGASQKQYTAILASQKDKTGRSFNSVFSYNDQYTCFNFNFDRPKEERIRQQYRYRTQVYGDLSNGYGSCNQPGVSFKADFTSQDNYMSSHDEQGRETCYQHNGQAECYQNYKSAIEEVKFNIDLSKMGDESMYIQSLADNCIDSIFGEYGEVVQRRRSRPDQMKVYARINYAQGNIMVTRTTAFGLKTYELPLPVDSRIFEHSTLMHNSELENWNSLLYGKEGTTCSVDGNTVTSFDGNTVNVRDNDCQVVLTHCLFCSSKVLVTSNLKANHREVHILFDNHEVVLRRGSPNGSPYNVEIDSKAQNIADESVLRVSDEGSVEPYIQLERSHQNLYVSLVREKMQVIYSPVSGRVQIQASHLKYGGRSQGVCGNMDGESRNDMVDEHQCVHTSQQVFAESYYVRIGTSSPEHCSPRRIPAPLCNRLNLYSAQLYSPSN